MKHDNEKCTGIILGRLSQWETTLHCNVVPHWLNPYPEWSLIKQINQILTHWGRVMHICVGKLTIIGSDNGLSPGRRQAIIWTNTAVLLIGPSGTNFSEILNEIQTFSLRKMSSAKCCQFHLGLNVLRWIPTKKLKSSDFPESLVE